MKVIQKSRTIFAFFLVVALCALTSLGAVSGAAPRKKVTSQPEVPIRSIARLPAEIRAKMPRQGTSRFYGVVPKAGPRNHDLMVHFFGVPDAKRDATNFTIQLFTRARVAGKDHYRLFNTSAFSDWTEAMKDGDEISLALLWLVPSKRHAPVIKIANSSSGAMYGLWRHDILVVYAGGIERKPVAAQFHSWASFDMSVNYDFAGLDTRGTMTVSDGTNSSGSNFYWTGSGFKQRVQSGRAGKGHGR